MIIVIIDRYNIMKIQFVLFYLWSINRTCSLRGHVCTRERAENYQTSYNQAFICQERYTTSCGHLDWRRCTRYRIQTCYTPKQRYATRYHQVEQCCPGWREDGAGACTVPVCTQLCLNGGSCVDSGGMPACSCQEGYSGDRCQLEKNDWKAWYTVLLCCFGLMVILGVAIIVYCHQRHKKIRPLIQQSTIPGSSSGSIPGNEECNSICWRTAQNSCSSTHPTAPPVIPDS